MEVRPTYYTYRNGKEEITEQDHPLTWKLIEENSEKITSGKSDSIYAQFIKEFYFVEKDYEPYMKELVTNDYNYNGINIYLGDEVAFQIIKMY